MKKQKAVAILTAVALILLLCGCARNTNSSNSKSNQTANIQDIAVLESGTTSTVHETAKEISEISSNTASKTSKAAQSSGSSENNSAQISSQSATLSSQSSSASTSSRGYTSTKAIFPEDSYSVAAAPYRYDYFKSVESVADIKNFIKEIDPLDYDGGYYYSLVKLIKENGYIPELYYGGRSLFDVSEKAEESITFENGVTLSIPNKIELHYEKGLTGVGYIAPQVEVEESVYAEIRVYYLRDSWIKAAEKEPFLYDGGKKDPAVVSVADAKAKKWIKKDIKINGKKTVTYISPGNQFMCYVCDGYMINIFLYGKGDYCEIAQKLSIKKVPLK